MSRVKHSSFGTELAAVLGQLCFVVSQLRSQTLDHLCRCAAYKSLVTQLAARILDERFKFGSFFQNAGTSFTRSGAVLRGRRSVNMKIESSRRTGQAITR